MVFYPIKTVLCIALYLSHGSVENFEIGPQDANREEFPFMAILQIPNGTICAGAIYNNRTIITAANCLENVILANNTEGVIITTGQNEWDVVTNYTRVFNASTVIIHENFEMKSFRDDIAIVKINGEFDWNSHVQPLEVVPPNLNTTGVRFCNITGWNTARGEPTKNLQRRRAHIISNTMCNGFLKSRQLDLHSNFCSDMGDDDLRHSTGDIGGPLICRGYLYGVRSNTYESGMHLYTDVRSHYEWIERNHSKSLIYSPLSILLLFCNTFTTYLFIVSIFN